MANDNSGAEPGETAPGIAPTFSRVWRRLGAEQRRRASGVLGLTFVETILDVFGLALVPPLVYLVSDLDAIHRHQFLARLFAWSGAPDERRFILLLVVAVFAVFVVRHAFGLFVLRLQHSFAYDVALDLIRRQFRAFLALDHEHAGRIPSTVAQRDIAIATAEFATSILLPCGVIVTEALVVAWILAGIVALDVRVLGLMVLVVVPPVLATRHLIRGRVQKLSEERLASRAEGFRVLAHGLFGFADLKLAGSGDRVVERSLQSFRVLFDAETRLAGFGHLPRQLVELSAVAGIGVLIGYAMLHPGAQADLVPILAILVAAAYRVMPSMTRLLTAWTRVKGSMGILDLLPAAAERVVPRVDVPAATFRSSLALEQVSFAYEGGRGFALRDITLEIRPGDRIGFVGPSGSGKTTLMNLVLRFLREQGGRVVLDGHALAEADDVRWQKLVGYVPQDPYLLDGTLAENVAFGDDADAVDRARVEAALRSASLGPLLDSLPRGIDSPVGEFGGTLSGGQRQRIAIARALYRNASVLVLDEATSALDAATERELIETLRALSADRSKTLLVIAHRGAILEVCDRVYALESGRLVAASPEPAATRGSSRS
jgi:ATP-binding cassette, subfamily B, bacterial PglK